ncbi:MAG: hypothetical protein EOO82_03595, partial [Oxalobacteraceae bacterium]
MRHSSIKTVSVFATFAAVLGLSGMLATYVRSEANPPMQTLTTQGFITPRTRALISNGNAYVLGPSEVVTDMSRIDKLAVSPDGGAILLAGIKARPYRGIALPDSDMASQMEQRFPELNLVYWDTRTRVAQTLLRESITAERQASIANVGWFAQTRVALVDLVRTSNGEKIGSLLRVDAATGTVTRLATTIPGQALSFSPRAPLAFL